MTSRRQLRAMLNVTYPWTRSMPLDHAIHEVRRLQARERAFNRYRDEQVRQREWRAYDRGEL